MATTDYDFNVTKNEIIERALRIVGAISLGDSVPGEYYAQASLCLNSLVKRWQSDHIFLWTVRSLTETLVSGAGSYAAPTDPAIVDIEGAFLRENSTGNDTPLIVGSWGDYLEIEDKDKAGLPQAVYLDARISQTIYTWPVINTSGYTLVYKGIVKLKDFDSASGNPDTNQKWIDALSYGTAEPLSDEFGLSIPERKAIAAKAQDFYQLAKKGDRQHVTSNVVKGAY